MERTDFRFPPSPFDELRATEDKVGFCLPDGKAGILDLDLRNLRINLRLSAGNILSL